MANEEEEYEVPSAPRKKEIELSKGVVLLPPERMKKLEEEAREEEAEIVQKRGEEKAKEAKAASAAKAKEEKREPMPITRPSAGGGLGSSVASVLAVIAILIALAAVGFSYLTLNSYNQMRTELKGVIVDLESFKESSFPISAEVTAEHVVQEEIALKDVLSPISFPVATTLHVAGSINAYNPGTRLMEEAPYEGNLTITGSINIDPSLLDSSRKMHLNYTVPGKGNMTIIVPIGRLWTSDMDDVLSRLENIAK